MEARFDFAAAWGEDSGPPPELPSHVWETITAGGNVAGLVEPDDAYGSLTAVMLSTPAGRDHLAHVRAAPQRRSIAN
jgi:hypothetical protein